MTDWHAECDRFLEHQSRSIGQKVRYAKAELRREADRHRAELAAEAALTPAGKQSTSESPTMA